MPKEKGLHPRNRSRERYDFNILVQSSPELAAFVFRNAHGDDSIDFADPIAVKALNRALLRHTYGIHNWDIPENYLCPPVPGRADVIHHIADLLGSLSNRVIPRGPSVRVLDIGVGANCIYPMIGTHEYGWKFLGTDIDPVALASADQIVKSNPGLHGKIELRLQKTSQNIFLNLLRADEVFDISICNPPFHRSREEAESGSHRKWKNLGKKFSSNPRLNFGGQPKELWCPGGELAFVKQMIKESVAISQQCLWFTTLVSKSSHLPEIIQSLNRAAVKDHKTIEIEHGQKKSRIVAWTF